MMMRKVDLEMFRREALALKNLEIAFRRLNNPKIHKSLRDSMYTKLTEMRAEVAYMQVMVMGDIHARIDEDGAHIFGEMAGSGQNSIAAG